MTALRISQLPFFLTGLVMIHWGRSYSMGVSDTVYISRILGTNHHTDFHQASPLTRKTS